MDIQVKIFHNPRCSKSRQTLELLLEKGFQPEVIEYLKSPYEKKDIERILKKLSKEPIDIIRTKEDIFKELALGASSSKEELIEAMVKNPSIVERPIVETPNKAAIGRPPEAVLEIL